MDTDERLIEALLIDRGLEVVEIRSQPLRSRVHPNILFIG